jgi:AmpE protein
VRAASEGDADDAWRRLQARLLYDGYQRWFAVVLVFVLLGPAWAFGYRLLQLEAQQAPERAAARVLFVVDWVPARLLALTFALAGDFMHSRDALSGALLDTARVPAELLGDVGTAAVYSAGRDADVQTAADDMQALGALLTRSAVIWVVAIALVAIIG